MNTDAIPTPLSEKASIQHPDDVPWMLPEFDAVVDISVSRNLERALHIAEEALKWSMAQASAFGGVACSEDQEYWNDYKKAEAALEKINELKGKV